MTLLLEVLDQNNFSAEFYNLNVESPIFSRFFTFSAPKIWKVWSFLLTGHKSYFYMLNGFITKKPKNRYFHRMDYFGKGLTHKDKDKDKFNLS